MTRDATPEYVKGDFGNVLHTHHGISTRMTREGDEFFFEVVDPDWAALRARAGDQADGLPPPKRMKLRVDRLVGSHWLQECMHRAPNGRYIRLPVLYHIGERRWIHSNGAFLTPDSNDFWSQSRGAAWNESCLYCHNTGPSKNPVRGPRGEVVRYETEVTELGIACAACHGPGTEHVRRKHDATAPPDMGDVVNPQRLSIPRRDEICARCHGALVPKESAWDPHTHRDPFVPGQKLTLYNSLFWSEAEQAMLVGVRKKTDPPPTPEPNDGRFWGDGTPLTTALEYNGMALSACYLKGAGKLSCLSCHTMHGDNPNFMLKPAMQTNEACYQCHNEYRGKLAEHTRHAADSSASLCYNCHMPHQVYSLMTTHRSHRIQIPALEGSMGTGKPHACNLCHLDKSLGWTRDQLGRWPGKRGASKPLSADEEKLSSAVLTLAQGDARSRAIVAGAFSNPGAREASGDDWYGSFLSRMLEHERYPAVRYLAHRGLLVKHADAANGYDFLALPAHREIQLRVMRAKFDAAPVQRPLPFLPLTPQGLPDQSVLDRLRARRHDPDVRINE
jgi:predicted CXXCH cytochrome family protein